VKAAFELHAITLILFSSLFARWCGVPDSPAHSTWSASGGNPRHTI